MMLKKLFYQLIHWEEWPYQVKYIPLAPVWLWYCLRARSLWFFTPSNPSLTFGGFEGETKMEMYQQLPRGSYPKTILISPDLSLEEVEELINGNGFTYPFIAKPDIGMMGLMFRKIETREQLEKYHRVIATGYLVQHLVTYPVEVSVFYYRFPGAYTGTITGFVRKDFLEVTGNGKSTLLQLIEGYKRVQFRLAEMKAKHANSLNKIIPKGERYILSPALNLSRGGKLVSLASEKDACLLSVFNRISHQCNGLFYGRFDIKCSSVEELKCGKLFSILEYNGCGAEPHHIYGNGNNLIGAYKIILQHWNVLYNISKLNHERGIPHWKFSEGLSYLRKARRYFRFLKQNDATNEF
ncbi:MAG TPA: hypothetical protein VEY06_15180 [Flavisolibacter sp.]|nr:hypothetical protein [Flavisolibacter sp.]